jgi:AcrR family transcriptional regulator
MANTEATLAAEDRKAAVRRRVLDAWGELLAGKGYGETTVADVATRAGLARSSVYRYFPDKEALFFAYIEDRITAFVVALRADVNAEQDAPSRLRRLVIGELRRFSESPEIGLSDVPELLSREGRGRLLACFQPLRDLVEEILEQGRSEGSLPALDVDKALPVVFACIDVFRVRLARQWIDPDAIADDVADFVLRGLGSSEVATAFSPVAVPTSSRSLGPVSGSLEEPGRTRMPSR